MHRTKYSTDNESHLHKHSSKQRFFWLIVGEGKGENSGDWLLKYFKGQDLLLLPLYSKGKSCGVASLLPKIYILSLYPSHQGIPSPEESYWSAIELSEERFMLPKLGWRGKKADEWPKTFQVQLFGCLKEAFNGLSRLVRCIYLWLSDVFKAARVWETF